jgi:integrase
MSLIDERALRAIIAEEITKALRGESGAAGQSPVPGAEYLPVAQAAKGGSGRPGNHPGLDTRRALEGLPRGPGAAHPPYGTRSASQRAHAGSGQGGFAGRGSKRISRSTPQAPIRPRLLKIRGKRCSERIEAEEPLHLSRGGHRGQSHVKQNKIWVSYKNELGSWSDAPTPYRPGEELKAQRFLRQIETRMTAVRQAATAGGAPDGPLTVAVYARKWIKERASLELATAADDDSRLKLHVLPRIGDMALEEVRSRHVRELILELRKEKKLAPRTIHHIYHAIAALLRDAVANELIEGTPWLVPRGTLPKKVDKDPAWRETAIYTREEVERLISDTCILEDRRVFYALKGLAGMRHGEAAGPCWRNYDPSLESLGSLSLHRTKTQVPRRVPVHPTLARILAEWKLAGFERTFGRPPAAEDLIVPSRNMTPRSKHEAPKQLHADLDLLELRRRRGHDLRRAFISLALADGARRDLLETVTHGPRGDIISVYNTPPWPALCEEVKKLRIELREGVVLAAAFGGLPTTFPTTHTKARNRWRKSVTPPGIEPGIAP